jgi:glycosyltransferase involved in cell wall biosynthesis
VAPAEGPAAQPAVAINGRAAVREQIGGVERFAREMAHRLPALRPERYRVIRPPSALAHAAGHAWEQGVLPVRASRCALTYSPANLAPVASRRNVVVIHDVAALRHPDAYSKAYAAYQRVMLPAIARRARLVITVSEFSKRELIEVLGAPPDRVEVIPAGVAERFGPTADPAPAIRRYGLEAPYALVVGTASARKNLTVLGSAWRALRDRGVELLLAGSDRSYLRAGEIPVRRLGYVADELLPGLYAGARVFAMPSLYEGFGLPCLEAMACGTPVVAASAGALPETVGDAGLLVDGSDPEAFATALVAAGCDERTHRGLVDAGLRRAARFTWARTAEATDATIGGLLCSEGRA